MMSLVFRNLLKKKNIWIVVPVFSFSGIFIGQVFHDSPVLMHSGVAGCVIASFILGAMAFVNEKKDIVSLLAPLYALIIFNPWSEFSTGFLMQLLYSFTLLVVVLRFKNRFYSDY